MNIHKEASIKKLFTSGAIDNLTFEVDRNPRIRVKAGARNGRELDIYSKQLGNYEKFVFSRLKDLLTTKDIVETFNYVVVDRASTESESHRLTLRLHDVGVDTYTGTLYCAMVKVFLNRMENPDTILSPEERAGISDTGGVGRYIFNVIGSEECREEGFDRMVRGRYVDLYLSTADGKYKAMKNDQCKALYAPLSHLHKDQITNDDLIKLMLDYAPVVSLKRLET